MRRPSSWIRCVGHGRMNPVDPPVTRRSARGAVAPSAGCPAAGSLALAVVTSADRRCAALLGEGPPWLR